MDEKTEDRTRGTWLDWPALLAVMGVVMAIYFGTHEFPEPGGVAFGLALAVFGLLTALIRRGTFSPRRD